MSESFGGGGTDIVHDCTTLSHSQCYSGECPPPPLHSTPPTHSLTTHSLTHSPTTRLNLQSLTSLHNDRTTKRPNERTKPSKFVIEVRRRSSPSKFPVEVRRRSALLKCVEGSSTSLKCVEVAEQKRSLCVVVVVAAVVVALFVVH